MPLINTEFISVRALCLLPSQVRALCCCVRLVSPGVFHSAGSLPLLADSKLCRPHSVSDYKVKVRVQKGTPLPPPQQKTT